MTVAGMNAPDDPARPLEATTFYVGQVVLVRIVNSQVLQGTAPGYFPGIIRQAGIPVPYPKQQGAPEGWGYFYFLDISTVHLPAWERIGRSVFVAVAVEGDLKPLGPAPAGMLGDWDTIHHNTGWRPQPPPRYLNNHYQLP